MNKIFKIILIWNYIQEKPSTLSQTKKKVKLQNSKLKFPTTKKNNEQIT